jgi:hypothetical protein
MADFSLNTLFALFASIFDLKRHKICTSGKFEAAGDRYVPANDNYVPAGDNYVPAFAAGKSLLRRLILILIHAH